jgi:hypothetical protein
MFNGRRFILDDNYTDLFTFLYHLHDRDPFYRHHEHRNHGGYPWIGGYGVDLTLSFGVDLTLSFSYEYDNKEMEDIRMEKNSDPAKHIQFQGW